MPCIDWGLFSLSPELIYLSCMRLSLKPVVASKSIISRISWPWDVHHHSSLDQFDLFCQFFIRQGCVFCDLNILITFLFNELLEAFLLLLRLFFSLHLLHSPHLLLFWRFDSLIHAKIKWTSMGLVLVRGAGYCAWTINFQCWLWIIFDF